MPATPARSTDAAVSPGRRPGQRTTALPHESARRLQVGREPAAERASRPIAAPAHSTASVLTADQFACFLERERSLADRGTRRFSLLALQRRAGTRGKARVHGALAELARRACCRLRSTDLVGRLDADRVQILLTDTNPAGAQVVAVWVERIESELGLDLELTIYVYPSPAAPDATEGHHRGHSDGVHSNGSTNGRSPRHSERSADTSVAATAPESIATNGNGHVNGHANGHRPRATGETSIRPEQARPDDRWPVKDLWLLLGVSTPPWKRSLDIVLSGLALLVLAPLFAVIALAIRLDSPGPVIFRQMRAGRGARPFVFYKFRSMIADAENHRTALATHNEQDGPVFKIRRDPRITRLGRLLRRGSIDELPQLWNVLKGDISLVGPRSPTFDEVCQYEPWQRRRLSVIGGITCTWQVSGRSEISFKEWMRLDMRYVACRNLWLDLRILAQTLPAVISGRGAC
jgi:lipopolysaccharide/colanic/teichoic acid biosynthesis glycosyltransferase